MKFLYTLFAMLLLSIPSYGNQNLGEEVPQAIRMMHSKKWAEAHRKFKRIVENFGERGEKLFGHRFGQIYYLKGCCEMKIARELRDADLKKAQFQMAADSMRECFEIHMRADKLHPKSLLYRAQAEQAMGNMATAFELNKLFLATQKIEKK